MEQRKTKHRRKTWIALAVLVVALLVIRAVLPVAARHYVNATLDRADGYDGQIGDIDLHLWRGAYQIEGVRIVKRDAKINRPFLEVRLIDISIQWAALLDGALVMDVVLQNPEVNFVLAEEEERHQTGDDRSWAESYRDLLPFRLNRLDITGGRIRMVDLRQEPKVDVRLSNLRLRAENLANREELGTNLVGRAWAKAAVQDRGEMVLTLHVNPLADQPTFDLNLLLAGVDLVHLNDFFRAYGNFDTEDGTLDVYAEFAAASGRFDGYVKPMLQDMEIVSLEQDFNNVLSGLWETVVGGVAELFENEPGETMATKVPYSGEFENPEADFITALASLLENAFFDALLPALDGTIDLESVEAEDG